MDNFPKPLAGESMLDQEVGKITLRDFLDALAHESKERVELAGVLRALSTAIDAVELGMHGCTIKEMERLKNLRDAFNRIPPKWLHA